MRKVNFQLVPPASPTHVSPKKKKASKNKLKPNGSKSDGQIGGRAAEQSHDAGTGNKEQGKSRVVVGSATLTSYKSSNRNAGSK